MEGASLSVAAFYLLATVAVAGAAGVAFSKNIIYSALSLMLSFMGVAGLYVVLSADFVAGVQVLIYVGGVLVLTLFAVMLTARIQQVEVSNRTVGRVPALIIVAGTFVAVWGTYRAAAWHDAALEPAASSTAEVGNALLTTYILPFELASIVLLSVLVGAVVLSRKELAEERGPQS